MHTLVIGGTGMLSGVTRWLVENGHVVSVMSRGRQPLPLSTVGSVHSVICGYRESDSVRERVAEAMLLHGPIDLAVFWIHSDAPTAFATIADEISSGASKPWRLFHVRGSAAHLDPQRPQVPPDCLYRQVLLGFVAQPQGSRWLTHGEISGGVIEAIRSDQERFVVGLLHPWEQRPR